MMKNDKDIVPALYQALKKRGYTELTPVQTAVLAKELRDADLLVSAQTGSGKTLAFGLNIAPTLLQGAKNFEYSPAPLALVVAPTRELAMQVKTELEWLYNDARASVTTCVGGMDIRDERRALQRGSHIVVGTPGRLRDHIERGSLNTTAFRAVVLDEADEMLDLGFREDLEYILASAPLDRRTLMFSATVPATIGKLAKRYQRDAVRVTTSSEKEQHGDIKYRAFNIAPNDRENAIINILRFYEPKNALVFCGTRLMVSRMMSRFTNRGISVVALSGELSQSQRTGALQAMRDGRAQVCIATDVAARGIDLPNLELVIHADLPKNKESLLHRSGRTGRAGRKGTCALMVPHSARRRTEMLLQRANVKATWSKPPSIDEILNRDQERIHEEPMLIEPLNDDEKIFVKELISRHGPEQATGAFVRLYRAGRSAPEELLDAALPEPVNAKQESFKNSVWFRLSIGQEQNAEPRWLVPMLCRGGHLTKSDIGSIRIQRKETFVELKGECVDRFVEAIGPDGMVEEMISATRANGPPKGERSVSRGARGDKRKRGKVRSPSTHSRRKAKLDVGGGKESSGRKKHKAQDPRKRSSKSTRTKSIAELTDEVYAWPESKVGSRKDGKQGGGEQARRGEKKSKKNKKKGKKRPKILTGGKPGRALGKKSSQGQADGPGP